MATGDTVKFNSAGYPLREGVEDCQHYLARGFCKFEKACKWNHPEGAAVPLKKVERTDHIEKEKDVSSDKTEQAAATGAAAVTFNSMGLPIRPGVEVCEFFMRSGGYCKYRHACKYSHPEEGCKPRMAKLSKKEGDSNDKAEEKSTSTLQQATAPPPKLNSLGLPLRDGIEDCRYYMKTKGLCGKLLCPYNHPENVALARLRKQKAEGNSSNGDFVTTIGEQNTTPTKAPPQKQASPTAKKALNFSEEVEGRSSSNNSSASNERSESKIDQVQQTIDQEVLQEEILKIAQALSLNSRAEIIQAVAQKAGARRSIADVKLTEFATDLLANGFALVDIGNLCKQVNEKKRQHSQ